PGRAGYRAAVLGPTGGDRAVRLRAEGLRRGLAAAGRTVPTRARLDARGRADRRTVLPRHGPRAAEEPRARGRPAVLGVRRDPGDAEIGRASCRERGRIAARA